VRSLPVKTHDEKPACVELRDLRVAHIARQVKNGTYFVSGREIAQKFIVFEQCSASRT
jgi:anti-sigma28 factor (negative regulator of flagellin synthesis)